jgi:E3 ubiquitin-protein ligase MARCH6
LPNNLQVLASNAIFLGLVAFFPFTLGRIVLSLASRLMVMGPFNVIFRPSVKNFLSSNMLDIGQNINTTINLVNTPESSMVGSSTFADMLLNASMQAPSIVQVAETVMDAKTFKFSDATTVAAGYTVIIIAVGFHLSLRALIKYIRGEQLTVNRLHGVASLAEAAPTVARQVISALKYMMTMLKVAFLLLVELGVFPLLCGWWLDICTLSMFGGTVSNRVAFFWASPLTSSLVHWLVGIVYMLHISIFVSLLREVHIKILSCLQIVASSRHAPFFLFTQDES